MSVRPRSIRLFGVPMDLGQETRGVDLGPGAIRYAGLRRRLRRLGHTVEDFGNIEVPVRDQVDPDERANYIPEIARVCQRMADAAIKACNEGTTPVFLGGDHSIAIGSVSGVAQAGRTGVIWVDAHGDYNTPETSPTGNVHGMPVAVLCGDGPEELVNVGGPGPKLRPEDIVQIGIRDLDDAERERLRDSGITVFTMRDVDQRGIGAVTRDALERLSHLDRLHVSFDLDSLEPREAPGVGTPVHGGLSYREAHFLCEIVADTDRLTSFDLVEVNPILDERNKTASAAVEMAESIFGASIL
ncbi:MAG: arginase [Phycisphaerales bacterium]